MPVNGLQGGVRLSVSVGSFAASGGGYVGRVAGIGSVGYAVEDIPTGGLLYSGSAFYEIVSSTVITAGAIAEITVNYLAGADSVARAPIAGRGQITAGTPNLNLPLFTQTGSNFLSPEQLARLLTHAMILIDSAGGQTTYGEYLSDEDADSDNVPTNATYTLANGNDYGMPYGILKKKTL